jgi:hypothetical protein
MAGSFGFDEEKYDLSMAIGELELLPAVRQTPADSLIIADGFSCREQIAQSTDRRSLHLAEVIAAALKAPLSPDGTHPETPYFRRRQAELDRSMRRSAVASAGLAAGVALLWWLRRKM